VQEVSEFPNTVVKLLKRIQNKILRYTRSIFSKRIIRQVRKAGLSFLSPMALTDIYRTVKRLEKQEVKGIFIEAGCALGGSAIVISKAKSPQRPFFIYDAFGMIPSPSENDGVDAHARYEIITSGQAKGINQKPYYGYEKDLLNKVKKNFKDFGVSLDRENIYFVKGLYQDTFRIQQEVAFAHIDADWYESVMICLEEIEPHLVSGSIMIIDDYYDWQGCKKAVDTFFADKKESYHFVKKSRLHIMRK